MPREASASPLPVLLGFLTIGPRHPYQLYREFDGELGRVWRIGKSHLYARLKELEASGLAAMRPQDRGDRPARTVYRITPAGRRVFAEWLHGPSPRARHFRLEFLARLYFYRRLAEPGLGALVEGQKAILASRAESLDRSIAEAKDEYWRLVLEFRRGEIAAILAWLGRCLEAT